MNYRWYFNRLRAMNIPEIRWRLEQKWIESAERKMFGKRQVKVTEKVFYRGKEDLAFHGDKLPIFGRDRTTLSSTISLLGGYRYERYKKDWHAGFQTQQKWPLIFSYDLDYKQRDDIGDARTNWELNRHFQFTLLACNYYQTGDRKYIKELSDLFHDWNEKNPFLYGISWTSVMEVAIRDMNWIYALGFLKGAAQGIEKEAVRDGGMGRADAPGASGQETQQAIAALCDQLRIGIINMTCYISNHYSRYSSANNHVIVEAAAMGLAGIVMGCEEWLETAWDILRIEIPRQNYQDGVNQEVSLHYQSFFMEAVGLLILTMQKNAIGIPQSWRNMLIKMSRYLSDCQGNFGETIVFGDDDEGKILDLEGIQTVDMVGGKESDGSLSECSLNHRNHYQYVLQLMSLILPERYVETIADQTLLCIVPSQQIQGIFRKPYYHNRKSICYPEGGVSILRSGDGRALIGIDHGPLGFGSIAAHGHADALSFQMYLDGEEVFADPGTYIYHIDLENRNAFRRTENHNTVTVNGKDQSEMLGAFLWGKRAQVKLLGHNLETGNQDSSIDSNADVGQSGCNREKKGLFFIEAEHDGYVPVIHGRRFVFDGKSCLKIYDKLTGIKGETEFQMHFLVGHGCRITEKALGEYEITTKKGCGVKIQIKGDALTTAVTDAWLSREYGIRNKIKKIQANGKAKNDVTFVIKIAWEIPRLTDEKI